MGFFDIIKRFVLSIWEKQPVMVESISFDKRKYGNRKGKQSVSPIKNSILYNALHDDSRSIKLNSYDKIDIDSSTRDKILNYMDGKTYSELNNIKDNDIQELKSSTVRTIFPKIVAKYKMMYDWQENRFYLHPNLSKALNQKQNQISVKKKGNNILHEKSVLYKVLYTENISSHRLKAVDSNKYINIVAIAKALKSINGRHIYNILRDENGLAGTNKKSIGYRISELYRKYDIKFDDKEKKLYLNPSLSDHVDKILTANDSQENFPKK